MIKRSLKKISEKPKPREPPVLLEQKIYNPSASKPPRPKPVQPFVPINQHNGMPLVNYPYPYANILNKVPIQKIAIILPLEIQELLVIL